MSLPIILNYTHLGLKKFEVFPHQINGLTNVDDILRKTCSINAYKSELWLLKEPIPFDQVSSKPWLLDRSTNLADHATRLFRAELLFDVWTDRDRRFLHAVLRTDP